MGVAGRGASAPASEEGRMQRREGEGEMPAARWGGGHARRGRRAPASAGSGGRWRGRPAAAAPALSLRRRRGKAGRVEGGRRRRKRRQLCVESMLAGALGGRAPGLTMPPGLPITERRSAPPPLLAPPPPAFPPPPPPSRSNTEDGLLPPAAAPPAVRRWESLTCKTGHGWRRQHRSVGRADPAGQGGAIPPQWRRR